MTAGKMTLADALDCLREVHAAERERALDAMDRILKVIAEATGVPLDEVRTRMKPHFDRQIETLDEMHRLAIADLVVMSEPGPNDHN